MRQRRVRPMRRPNENAGQPVPRREPSIGRFKVRDARKVRINAETQTMATETPASSNRDSGSLSVLRELLQAGFERTATDVGLPMELDARSPLVQRTVDELSSP